MMVHQRMPHTRELFRDSRSDPSQLGQAMTEFVLILALVVIPFIAVFNRFQDAIITALNNIAGLLSGPGV